MSGHPQRPSLASRRSSASQASVLWRVRSISSGASTPLISGLTSPDPAGKKSLQAQKWYGQLIAFAKGDLNPSELDLYCLLRGVLQRSIIFDLFEERDSLQALALGRLRLLGQDDLRAMVKQCGEIIHWRQDNACAAKMANKNTPLQMAGLVAAARTLLGEDRMRAACLVAKNSISHNQRVEKRFTVLLLAVAAAMDPSGTPCDLEGLRSFCKPVLDRLHVGRTPGKELPHQLQQLMQKVGRYLTDKRGDKIAELPQHLMMDGDPLGDAAPLDTPSEKDFVHVDAKDCLANPATAVVQEAEPASAAQAPKKGWLAKMWA